MLKKKSSEFSIHQKYTSKNEVEIKTFSDKRKLTEWAASNSAQQEMLQEFFGLKEMGMDRWQLRFPERNGAHQK